MTTTIDLTPFEFTPTESRIYNSLLDLGPSSGYGLARALGLARANTYHAMESLRAKGAITVLSDHPLRVRAVRPDDLVTLIGSRYSERLEALDGQVRRRGQSAGAETMVVISTERALLDIATRMIVREESSLLVVAPERFYGATAQAWRKRKVDDRPGRSWSFGEGASQLDKGPQLDSSDIIQRFGSEVVLMASDSSALWATWSESVAGWWTHERLAVGLVGASIANIGGL